MGATSVTGTGTGDSGGKQKPNNHSGCSCSGSSEPEEVTTVKTGCYIRYSAGRKTSYRTRSVGPSIKVC